MDLHISTEEQIAIQSGWNGDAHSDITARIGDNWAVNAFFYSRNRRHRDRPYDLIHYAAAGVVANLIDFNGNVLATANLATELVPAVTAPVVTRVVPGTATVGEYDRITLPSPPGSGSLSVAMRGGTASLRGGTSATARIVPTVTAPRQAAAAFASMLGAPWTMEFVSGVIVDVHGTIVTGGGTTAFVQSVDVSDLQYLYGWSGVLNLAAVDPSFAGQPDVYPVWLVIMLTPSGGAAAAAAKIPVRLLI